MNAASMGMDAPPTPHEQRRRRFFWLGVGALPVFWSWFTLGRRFSRRQRQAAFGWMAVYLLLIACLWDRLVLGAAVLQASPALASYWMAWTLFGVGCWVWMEHGGGVTALEVLVVLFVVGAPILSMMMGQGEIGPFFLMIVSLMVMNRLLAWWERRMVARMTEDPDIAASWP
ncbi:MAG: hypothetical protein ACO1TE_05575 [Prosthecobacter sp.]